MDHDDSQDGRSMLFASLAPSAGPEDSQSEGILAGLSPFPDFGAANPAPHEEGPVDKSRRESLPFSVSMSMSSHSMLRERSSANVQTARSGKAATAPTAAGSPPRPSPQAASDAAFAEVLDEISTIDLTSPAKQRSRKASVDGGHGEPAGALPGAISASSAAATSEAAGMQSAGQLRLADLHHPGIVPATPHTARMVADFDRKLNALVWSPAVGSGELGVDTPRSTSGSEVLTASSHGATPSSACVGDMSDAALAALAGEAAFSPLPPGSASGLSFEEAVTTAAAVKEQSREGETGGPDGMDQLSFVSEITQVSEEGGTGHGATPHATPTLLNTPPSGGTMSLGTGTSSSSGTTPPGATSARGTPVAPHSATCIPSALPSLPEAGVEEEEEEDGSPQPRVWHGTPPMAQAPPVCSSRSSSTAEPAAEVVTPSTRSSRPTPPPAQHAPTQRGEEGAQEVHSQPGDAQEGGSDPWDWDVPNALQEGQESGDDSDASVYVSGAAAEALLQAAAEDIEDAHRFQIGQRELQEQSGADLSGVLPAASFGASPATSTASSASSGGEGGFTPFFQQQSGPMGSLSGKATTARRPAFASGGGGQPHGLQPAQAGQAGGRPRRRLARTPGAGSPAHTSEPAPAQGATPPQSPPQAGGDTPPAVEAQPRASSVPPRRSVASPHTLATTARTVARSSTPPPSRHAGLDSSPQPTPALTLPRPGPAATPLANPSATPQRPLLRPRPSSQARNAQPPQQHRAEHRTATDATRDAAADRVPDGVPAPTVPRLDAAPPTQPTTLAPAKPPTVSSTAAGRNVEAAQPPHRHVLACILQVPRASAGCELRASAGQPATVHFPVRAAFEHRHSACDVTLQASLRLEDSCPGLLAPALTVSPSATRLSLQGGHLHTAAAQVSVTASVSTRLAQQLPGRCKVFVDLRAVDGHGTATAPCAVPIQLVLVAPPHPAPTPAAREALSVSDDASTVHQSLDVSAAPSAVDTSVDASVASVEGEGDVTQCTVTTVGGGIDVAGACKEALRSVLAACKVAGLVVGMRVSGAGVTLRPPRHAAELHLPAAAAHTTQVCTVQLQSSLLFAVRRSTKRSGSRRPSARCERQAIAALRDFLGVWMSGARGAGVRVDVASSVQPAPQDPATPTPHLLSFPEPGTPEGGAAAPAPALSLPKAEGTVILTPSLHLLPQEEGEEAPPGSLASFTVSATAQSALSTAVQGRARGPGAARARLQWVVLGLALRGLAPWPCLVQWALGGGNTAQVVPRQCNGGGWFRLSHLDRPPRVRAVSAATADAWPVTCPLLVWAGAADVSASLLPGGGAVRVFNGGTRTAFLCTAGSEDPVEPQALLLPPGNSAVLQVRDMSDASMLTEAGEASLRVPVSLLWGTEAGRRRWAYRLACAAGTVGSTPRGMKRLLRCGALSQGGVEHRLLTVLPFLDEGTPASAAQCLAKPPPHVAPELAVQSPEGTTCSPGVGPAPWHATTVVVTRPLGGEHSHRDGASPHSSLCASDVEDVETLGSQPTPECSSLPSPRAVPAVPSQGTSTVADSPGPAALHSTPTGTLEDAADTVGGGDHTGRHGDASRAEGGAQVVDTVALQPRASPPQPLPPSLLHPSSTRPAAVLRQFTQRPQEGGSVRHPQSEPSPLRHLREQLTVAAEQARGFSAHPMPTGEVTATTAVSDAVSDFLAGMPTDTLSISSVDLSEDGLGVLGAGGELAQLLPARQREAPADGPSASGGQGHAPARCVSWTSSTCSDVEEEEAAAAATPAEPHMPPSDVGSSMSRSGPAQAPAPAPPRPVDIAATSPNWYVHPECAAVTWRGGLRSGPALRLVNRGPTAVHLAFAATVPWFAPEPAFGTLPAHSSFTVVLRQAAADAAPLLQHVAAAAGGGDSVDNQALVAAVNCEGGGRLSKSLGTFVCALGVVPLPLSAAGRGVHAAVSGDSLAFAQVVRVTLTRSALQDMGVAEAVGLQDTSFSTAGDATATTASFAASLSTLSLGTGRPRRNVSDSATQTEQEQVASPPSPASSATVSARMGETGVQIVHPEPSPVPERASPASPTSTRSGTPTGTPQHSTVRTSPTPPSSGGTGAGDSLAEVRLGDSWSSLGAASASRLPHLLALRARLSTPCPPSPASPPALPPQRCLVQPLPQRVRLVAPATPSSPAASPPPATRRDAATSPSHRTPKQDATPAKHLRCITFAPAAEGQVSRVRVQVCNRGGQPVTATVQLSVLLRQEGEMVVSPLRNRHCAFFVKPQHACFTIQPGTFAMLPVYFCPSRSDSVSRAVLRVASLGTDGATRHLHAEALLVGATARS